MGNRQIWGRIILAGMIILAAGSNLLGQEAISNSDCMNCHDVAGGEIGKTIDSSLAMSSHSGMSCTDCHSSIKSLPHDEKVAPVDCGICHTTESEQYKWHGRLQYPGGSDIPDCADCHGKHDILPVTNKDSRINPINLPMTCGRCHSDLNLVKKHDILIGNAVSVYESSVHGKAALGGVYTAATCNDCHSTAGTAHKILSPGDPESSINHFNIPRTCGKCHRNVENDYWEGIHGKLVARGETDAPVCTNCHGEHGIIAPSDPRSPVSPARIAEATCSPCHESAYLNEKYGIPGGRLKSFVDSYHGLKSKAGDVTVANCSSCHGAHRILPHSDPTSSIFPANLRKTCGQCHPGISAEMAKTPIHSTPGISQTPLARTIGKIYIVVIILIIGLMLVHWLIDLRKQIKNISLKEQIKRMTYNEVWQHTFLMVTFITLVITGFALRYSESWWVQIMFGWEGGFPVRGIVHRTAAVLFILTSLWHLFYLTTPRGRQFLKDIFPNKKDFGEFIQMIKYNLGFKVTKPAFGRFSYIEKAEYWALVWGTGVMILSGLFLWFDNLAVAWFPKGFLDVMLVMHFYEAWLAFLAILIWHMYSTVFSPNVYPMNPSWYTGKMPKEWYEHEHPDDPALKEKEETVEE
ncbi:11 hemes c containing cytochrome [Candidatus Zixiibacteriota bacterium]|nr:11 hemes c containing cytochrome [candidate division Zixibacteria bacterium]